MIVLLLHVNAAGCDQLCAFTNECMRVSVCVPLNTPNAFRALILWLNSNDESYFLRLESNTKHKKNSIKFNILLPFKNRPYSAESIRLLQVLRLQFCHTRNDSLAYITLWMSFMIFYSWHQTISFSSPFWRCVYQTQHWRAKECCKPTMTKKKKKKEENSIKWAEIFTVVFYVLCCYRWIYRRANNGRSNKNRHLLAANSSCCKNPSPEYRAVVSLKLSYSFLCAS